MASIPTFATLTRFLPVRHPPLQEYQPIKWAFFSKILLQSRLSSVKSRVQFRAAPFLWSVKTQAIWYCVMCNNSVTIVRPKRNDSAFRQSIVALGLLGVLLGSSRAEASLQLSPVSSTLQLLDLSAGSTASVGKLVRLRQLTRSANDMAASGFVGSNSGFMFVGLLNHQCLRSLLTVTWLRKPPETVRPRRTAFRLLRPPRVIG